MILFDGAWSIMLKVRIQGVKKPSDRGTGFDPSRSDDPLAQKVDWRPLKRGGTNFCTRRLVEVGAHRLEFRPTVSARLFYLAFVFVGLVFLVLIPAAMASRHGVGIEVLFPVLFGLVFAAVGGCMYYFGTTPVVFDRGTNHYWKGRTSPDLMPDRHAKDNWTDLEKIHALQIISEWCRSNKSSYRSYELNLVLSDGSRLNAVDHGNPRKLREDAATLARFLDVPVWDAG